MGNAGMVQVRLCVDNRLGRPLLVIPTQAGMTEITIYSAAFA